MPMENLEKNKDTRRVLRLKNIQNLLDILLQRGEVARVELSQLTGLTKTTITSLVKDLIDKGIVREKEPILNKVGVGRNIIPLKIKKDAVYTIGIKLARHHLSGLLINTHGEILYKKDGPVYKDTTPGEIIDILFDIIDDIMASNKYNKIETIGIGMPGPLDTARGIVMNPPNLSGWRDVPLAKIVSDRYKVPVWIENDANCAALAEKWYGGARELDTFLFILLSDGIGGGIIRDGQLYKSPRNYEAEVGHIVLRYKGKVGFLEDFCRFDLIDNPLSFKDNREFLDILYLIGEAIATISNIIGPEKIFIGGKMAVLGNEILKPIKERIDKYSFGKKIDVDIPVEISSIYEDAISIGAATHAMRKYIIRKMAGDIK